MHKPLKTNVIFVSDVHLCSPKTKNDRTFLLWLENLQGATLYILGDFFDLWWSFGDYVPKQYEEVCNLLKKKIAEGMKIYILGGNRDFSNTYLQSIGLNRVECGVHKILGKDIYIAHGDEMDRSLGYRVLRKLLRSYAFDGFMRLLGPRKGYRFLRLLKSGSSEVRLGGANLLQNQKDWVKENPFAYVIMGHSHYLGSFSLEEKTLVLLGDWPNHKSYFCLTDEGGTLYSLDEPVQIGLFC